LDAVSSVSAFAAVRATISGADHSFCTAAFCSPRLGRRGFAFSCIALPRRHCSTSSTALGSQPQRVGDELLDPFLSLLHVAAFLLGRFSLSICPDWYGFWSYSGLTWFSADPLGKPTQRTFLHSEPLASASGDAGNRGTFYLRLVARHALRQQRSQRPTFANDRLRNAAFSCCGCRLNRLLSRLFDWSASANHASRENGAL
jgi:hypothetical protein